MSKQSRSRVDVTDVSKLKDKVIERVIQDSGAGRITFYLLFSDGTQLGWSYSDGGTFVKRPGEPVRDVL